MADNDELSCARPERADADVGTTMSVEALVALSRAAAEHSYSPYSKFRVGAAVVMDGHVFTGANIENASYGLTICAERVAIAAAAAAGHRKLQAVAVTCLDASSHATSSSLAPCGACRQVIQEFGRSDTPVHIDRLRTMTLAELLPEGFGV